MARVAALALLCVLWVGVRATGCSDEDRETMESLLKPVATHCVEGCDAKCRTEIDRTVTVSAGVQACLDAVVSGKIETLSEVDRVLTTGRAIVQRCREQPLREHAQAAANDAATARKAAETALKTQQKTQAHVEHLSGKVAALSSASKELSAKVDALEAKVNAVATGGGEAAAEAKAVVEDSVKDLKELTGETKRAQEMSEAQRKAAQKQTEEAMTALSGLDRIENVSEEAAAQNTKEQLDMAKQQNAKLDKEIDAAAAIADENAAASGLERD